MRHPNHAFRTAHGTDFLVLALIVGLKFLPMTYIALQAAFPVPIDELGHYAYVAYIATSWDISPALHLITQPQGEFYLNHPPFYYALLAPIHALFDGSATALRAANIPLAAAFTLLLYATYRRAGLPPAASGLLLFVLTLPPMVGAMGGWINNDNLAYLAAAMASLALAGSARRDGTVMWGLLASALALAGLTKANAFAGVGLLAAGALVMEWSVDRKPPWRGVALLAAGGLVGALPYAAFLIEYATPVPNTRALDGVPHSAGAERKADDALQYLGWVWKQMAWSFTDPLTNHVTIAVGKGAALALWLAPLIALLRVRTRRARLFCAMTMASLWGLTALHLQHTWGYLGAVYVRYYVPVLPLALLTLAFALAPRLTTTAPGSDDPGAA